MKLSFFNSHFPSPRRSERAVALVITLLLLAVITFMAVTFLVVSRNEHGNVATQTDLNVAKFAADSALARAQMEMTATILANTNPLVISTVLVPTNFNNPVGFIPGNTSPTNVNYDNTISGTPLALNDRLQNLANLLYDPRPPVFIVTNALFPNSNDFRFYLDINRNGRFEGTGFQPVISTNPATPYFNNTTLALMAAPSPGITLSNVMVGDPQWIGVLQRPQLAHSADNQFVSRYTYLVVPAGLALDANAIHNDAKFPVQNKMGTADGFLRNQGVMTSELNLAAFLADLNTNAWPLQSIPGFQPYNYATNSSANQGVAFSDAQNLLYYRYNGSTKSLAMVQPLFGIAGVNAFQNPIDLYSQGPLMFGTSWPPPGSGNPNVGGTGYVNKDPWQGSRNPNRFSSPGDFFNLTKTAQNVSPGNNFTTRLQAVGNNPSSYDQYTFYRLLSQLGTDSDSDSGGKMNLNYANVDPVSGYVVPGMVTNFLPWQPTNFFVNAAIRLLSDAGYTVGNPNAATNVLVTNAVNTRINGHNLTLMVTNLHIPIYPTNYYTSSLHRLLQLAANLYDAATNRADYNISTYPFLPTAVRPIYLDQRGKGGSLFIVGYNEVTTTDTTALKNNTLVFHDPAADTTLVRPFDMVYGVPVVIGAEKGLPNFNRFHSQTYAEVTRKLQFTRQSATAVVSQTNQAYFALVTNSFQIQAWNSYTNNWNYYASGRSLSFYVYPDIGVSVSNRVAPYNVVNIPYPTNYVSPPINSWPGNSSGLGASASFMLSPLMSFTNLPYTRFLDASHTFYVDPPGPIQFELNPPDGTYYIPQWDFRVTTHLRVAIVDNSANRLLDYVNLSVQTFTNLTELLTTEGQCGLPYTPDGHQASFWCTNRYPDSANGNPNALTYGIRNQIAVTMGQTPYVGEDGSPPAFGVAGINQGNMHWQIDEFLYQFGPTPNGLGAKYGSTGMTILTNFGALNPTRRIWMVNDWQANDPLVHYTVADLTSMGGTNAVSFTAPQQQVLNSVNDRYRPWGKVSSTTLKPGVNQWEMNAKDPMPARLASSDYWDLSVAKYPNPGWIGRVHRGTPWQTVFFKSLVTNSTSGFVNLAAWQTWTGNGQVETNFGQISTNVAPYYLPQAALANGYPPSAFASAVVTQPTKDWSVLDLFSTAFSDTATRGQLSVNMPSLASYSVNPNGVLVDSQFKLPVNQPNLAAWSAVLSGVIVLTNNPNVVDTNGNPVLSPLVIPPAGYYDPNNVNTWPQLVRIINALNVARAKSPGGVFTNFGQLLSVPILTVASPFIDTSIPPDNTQGPYMLSDAAYERIPQQILGLLKLGSPRYVVYSWGQTLKPAPHSAYTGSGQFFGMITNYQIMAEVATRAVIRFDGAPTTTLGGNAIPNLHPVIESFSVLPPD